MFKMKHYNRNAKKLLKKRDQIFNEKEKSEYRSEMKRY